MFDCFNCDKPINCLFQQATNSYKYIQSSLTGCLKLCDPLNDFIVSFDESDEGFYAEVLNTI